LTKLFIPEPARYHVKCGGLIVPIYRFEPEREEWHCERCNAQFKLHTLPPVGGYVE
jgi:hypothetical protein